MYRYFCTFVKQFTTPIFFVFLMTLFGVFLRFYNLNWGAPFYFHPDERNVASAVSQLVFPGQLNPHFFAYGSFPIYTIFFTGMGAHWLQCTMYKVQCTTSSITFESAIVISRFYSALFSVILIPLLYHVGKKLKDERTGLLSGFLGLMSVGFIQYAHFGTFEMWLTMESVLLFYLCLLVLERHREYYSFLLGLVFGLSVGTKVSQMALLPLPILSLFWKECGKNILSILDSCCSFLKPIFSPSFPLSSRRAPSSAPSSSPPLSKLADSFQSVPLKGEETAAPSPLWGEGEVWRNRYFKQALRKALVFLRESLFFLAVALLVYFLTNPFVVLDFQSFMNSMHYESSVALGTMKVFYTGEFFHSVPIVFQFLHVYPFLLNPLLTCSFVFGFGYVLFLFIKKKHAHYFFLIFFYLVLFLSEAFFYVKWTRYLVPTLPFVYLMVSLLFSSAWLRRRVFAEVFVVITVLIASVFALAYFITGFVRPDTRVAAAYWAKSFIPSDAEIMSEVYDLGITPFNDYFHRISLFNFYDLDTNAPESNSSALSNEMAKSSYIILPSQRILKVRILNRKDFPQGYGFYQALLSGSLGYKKIYESACDVLCMISYFGSPIYRYEETANVFDRPVVEVYQKIGVVSGL